MGAGGCAHGRRCRAKTETGNDENLCFVAALIGYGLCKCQRLRAFYGSHMQKQEAFPQYLPKTEWLHRAIGGELDLTKLDGELVCTMHEYPCLCKVHHVHLSGLYIFFLFRRVQFISLI